MKLLLVAGARPNFMKIAPLIRAAETRNAALPGGGEVLQWRLVHTGQHYDARMSQIFFRELGIPEPDLSLEVGSGSHAQQTARVMERFEPVCLEEEPNWVVVVGDVNSTVACTLVASKLGIPVAHVEAGLRSFDRSMPEELNRLVTDALADLLLTPSPDADANLRAEGVSQKRIVNVGNVMIDSLVSNLDAARASSVLSDLDLENQPFAFVTLHRPANVDTEESLRAIFESLNALGKTLPVVLPLHPRTKKMLDSFGLVPACTDSIRLIEPVGYHACLRLAEEARLVVTDSGGLQEETTFFRTPCLTLRPNTERPVTLVEGSNRLTEIHRLDDDVRELLNGPRRRGRVPALWDGRTAERICDALLGARESASRPDPAAPSSSPLVSLSTL